jgi:DNA-binding response OmpR family regulator
MWAADKTDGSRRGRHVKAGAGMTALAVASERPARILVVDDDESDRQLLEVLLAAEGFIIVTAASGAEGLAVIARDPPDLILLDVMMPDVDGFAVCRRIKEDARLKEVPVIFLTAKGGGEALAEGFESGALMYINKPFTANKLLTIVHTMLESGTNLT